MAGLFRLLDLADEILFLVAEYLEACPRDLCALACVCRRLDDVADSYCYRNLLIRSRDQLIRLSNALQRKPRRLAFTRDLILVPAITDASNIMSDSLYFIIEFAHMLRHLTVELPFHNDVSTAASLKSKCQDRFGELFETTSLISCVPKPRALQRLRSCKLNFQHEQGKPWVLGKNNMVFLHDTLESLTLVAAEIGSHNVSYLRHHKKLTPLSHLHLDHCDVAPEALEIILSVPQALQSLELTEYDYGRVKYATLDPEELMIALSPQGDSLRDLQLGLRSQKWGVRAPYNFCNFTSLRKLTLECMSLDDVVDFSLAMEGRMIKITGHHYHIVWIISPKHPFTLVLQTPPDYMLDTDNSQAVIERLGRSLRIPNESSLRSSLTFGTRLTIVRQTEMKGAIAPYLYDEHVPEKIVCYDSIASASNWDFKTDDERQRDANIPRILGMIPLPNVLDGDDEDFGLSQLNSA